MFILGSGGSATWTPTTRSSAVALEVTRVSVVRSALPDSKATHSFLEISASLVSYRFYSTRFKTLGVIYSSICVS